MVDFNNVLKAITNKLGNKIESSDKLKEMVSNLGDKFSEKVQSGKFAEGSIFDAASKLGINSKDDLKNVFAQFKNDPKATMSDTFSKLKDNGYFEAFTPEHLNASFEKAAGINRENPRTGGTTEQAAQDTASPTLSKPSTTYSKQDITKAYRQAAKLIHPDSGHGNTELMQQLNVLKDATNDGKEESAQQFFNFIQKNNLV